jgi:hypothetical protein
MLGVIMVLGGAHGEIKNPFESQLRYCGQVGYHAPRAYQV